MTITPGRRRFIKWAAATLILVAIFAIGWRPLRRHLALWWFAANGVSVGFEGGFERSAIQFRFIKVKSQLPEAVTAQVSVPPFLFVDMLEFSASDLRVGDAGLGQLEFFPELESVSVYDPTISDSGLRSLSRLRKLRDLSVSVPYETGAGFESLANLERLEKLTLFGNGLTQSDLRVIGRLQNLKLLWLWNKDLRGGDLQELAPLKQLRSLSVSCSDQSALADLPTLALLKEVYLTAPIKDEDLKHLQRFPRLSMVIIHGDRLTPACVRYLDQMPSLEAVALFVRSPAELDAALASRPESQRPSISVHKWR